jgi:diadenosine tetraphosphate (Ap4A) HIT family hydrolase
MMTMAEVSGCELCEQPGGEPVMSGPGWRVVRVLDADFPGFYRVVWESHVAEFSDLDLASRTRCMEVVARVESVLRECLKPTKVNLASFGNVVPHLHWHVIARFDWDSHFPQPLWGARQREVGAPKAVDRLPVPMAAVDDALRLALRALS